MTVTARSYHPGGVNLGLGDGSVHFVAETSNIDVWRRCALPRVPLGKSSSASSITFRPGYAGDPWVNSTGGGTRTLAVPGLAR